jgi:hypothetical protein
MSPHRLLAFVFVLFIAASLLRADDLRSYSSRCYAIRSDLPADEVRDFANHMDQVFVAYQQRFAGFRSRRAGPMPLFLFRTRQGYLHFLASHGINAYGSGGMFFVHDNIQGLATFLGESPRSRVLAVLQHEGFHQFAFNYIGPDLPTWVNEGLAEYFEDGLIVRGKLTTGLADADRIARVKLALDQKSALDFHSLLNMSNRAWSENLRTYPDLAALQYAQSWSIVYFLIHGNDGKYRPAFNQYLQLVSTGRDSDRAFATAFGSTDTTAFRERWEIFAAKHVPDPLTTALQRLDFLSVAITYLMEQKVTMPTSFDELQQELTRREFRVQRSSQGLVETFTATDAVNFTYTRPDGTAVPFVMLEPQRHDLPPRLTAPGLKPEPTLQWSRDTAGELVQDIAFR